MKRRVLIGLATGIVLTLTGGIANAQSGTNRAEAQALAPAQLERQVAPIALYPDALLAQILPATTAPEDILRANAFLRSKGYRATRDINDQNWNLSVRSLSYYPPIVQGLATNARWTMRMGQAFVTQERDVLDAIQRLRARAYRSGRLRTTMQQRVAINGDMILLYPGQSNYLYIPVYDPAMFWVTTGSQTVGGITITYSSGFPVWLNLDVNWDSGQVYYHHWDASAGGWVAFCRPYALVNGGGVYINDNYDNRYFINNSVIYRPLPSGGVSPAYPVMIDQRWRPSADTLNRPMGVPHPTGNQVPHPTVNGVPHPGVTKP